MEDKRLFIKISLDSWQGQLKAVNTILGMLSDEQFEHEVSPTRNRGIYILGHLTAVHDLMLPLLRFEESIYPDLQPVFVDAPDRAMSPIPTVVEIRAQWNEVNEKLRYHFFQLSPDDWFTRHANVSEADFAKEPTRNRLNVLLGRTAHLSYHRGQLVFLVRKR
jgi:hypothetical protein